MFIPFPSFFIIERDRTLRKEVLMPDIKTRDIAKGTIKTIDKSAVVAERMKSAFIQTKEKAEHSVDVPESKCGRICF